MIPDISARISETPVWNKFSPAKIPGSCSGFTLLELIISMTIISMLVMVLYFSFSVGSRAWNDDSSEEDHTARLEAVLRLLDRDLSGTVPYNMNWEKGSISLFAGGPNSLFYVTKNGTGSFAGPGSGLYFSLIFIDHCPENSDKCLYLYKSPRPGPDFVDAVDRFRAAGETGRRNFHPGDDISRNSMAILAGLEDLSLSYSQKEFLPFADSGREAMKDPFAREGELAEKDWLSNDLPGQARASFTLHDREYAVQVPVGY